MFFHTILIYFCIYLEYISCCCNRDPFQWLRQDSLFLSYVISNLLHEVARLHHPKCGPWVMPHHICKAVTREGRKGRKVVHPSLEGTAPESGSFTGCLCSHPIDQNHDHTQLLGRLRNSFYLGIHLPDKYHRFCYYGRKENGHWEIPISCCHSHILFWGLLWYIHIPAVIS